MLRFRYSLIILGMLSSPMASADVQFSIGIGTPHVNIGINMPSYPEMVVIPGYPVYYAPRLSANLFFYDGMYWAYQNDYWYASSWFNGPWWVVTPEVVPVYILRVPVRYYGNPPRYFRGWRSDYAPRWGDHWGRNWEQRRSDWNRWDRRYVPAAAPPPSYQRQYSGDRYPRQLDQQHSIQQRNYHYQPREPAIRQHYEQQSVRRPSTQKSSPNGHADDHQQLRGQSQQVQQNAPGSGSAQQSRPQPQDQRQNERQSSPNDSPQQKQQEQQNRGRGTSNNGNMNNEHQQGGWDRYQQSNTD
jgi:hypothetical protein